MVRPAGASGHVPYQRPSDQRSGLLRRAIRRLTAAGHVLTLQTILAILQGITFVALGIVLMVHGEYRLGASQFLLAAVNVIIYY